MSVDNNKVSDVLTNSAPWSLTRKSAALKCAEWRERELWGV